MGTVPSLMQLILAQRILGTWGVDISVSLSTNPTKNQYTLTVFDHLSRWVEAISTSEQSVSEATCAFVRNVSARFGTTEAITTD